MQLTIQTTLPSKRQLHTPLIWTESGWVRRNAQTSEVPSPSTALRMPNLQLMESNGAAWEALFDQVDEE